MWNEWNIPQLADFSDPKCGSHQMWKSFFKHRLFSLFLEFLAHVRSPWWVGVDFQATGASNSSPKRPWNERETVLRNGHGSNDLASMMMKWNDVAPQGEKYVSDGIVDVLGVFWGRPEGILSPCEENTKIHPNCGRLPHLVFHICTSTVDFPDCKCGTFPQQLWKKKGMRGMLLSVRAIGGHQLKKPYTVLIEGGRYGGRGGGAILDPWKHWRKGCKIFSWSPPMAQPLFVFFVNGVDIWTVGKD